MGSKGQLYGLGNAKAGQLVPGSRFDLSFDIDMTKTTWQALIDQCLVQVKKSEMGVPEDAGEESLRIGDKNMIEAITDFVNSVGKSVSDIISDTGGGPALIGVETDEGRVKEALKGLASFELQKRAVDGGASAGEITQHFGPVSVASKMEGGQTVRDNDAESRAAAARKEAQIDFVVGRMDIKPNITKSNVYSLATRAGGGRTYGYALNTIGGM